MRVMGLAQPGVSTPHDVQGWRRTWTVATSPECRGLRVVILLFATFLMGVADLALTLTYVTSIGMVELNPLARYIMEHGSVQAVALFKFGAMTVNGGILYIFRRRRIAEIAAWICFLVMAGLSIKWGLYASHMSSFASELHETMIVDDARFVMMSE
ncbi:MAG: DUF5658 family protein [Phycisphaerales bacterium]